VPLVIITVALVVDRGGFRFRAKRTTGTVIDVQAKATYCRGRQRKAMHFVSRRCRLAANGVTHYLTVTAVEPNNASSCGSRTVQGRQCRDDRV
jgi:hypothetical protein